MRTTIVQLGLSGLLVLFFESAAFSKPEPYEADAFRIEERASLPPAPQPMTLVLGVLGGAFLPSSEHELYDSTQSFHAPFNEVAAKLGLRLGFFPFEFFGIEGEAGYAPTRNARSEDNHIFDVRGHAVIQYPWRVTPFLLAGGGLIGVEGIRGGDVDEALHWGGGLKFFLNSRVNVRLDGRHVVSSRLGRNTGNSDHFEVTAGVGVVLFREEEVPVYVAEAPPPSDGLDPPPRPAAAAPDPVPVPKPVEAPVVVVERTLYVESMDPVRFRFGSARLPAGFETILREVLNLMAERPELDVVVVGHADATGPAEYNLLLSERRAQSVAVFLVKRGIERPRIRVRGEGERVPVASNDTAKGRAKNRRTEITVIERRDNPDLMEARRGEAPPLHPSTVGRQN